MAARTRKQKKTPDTQLRAVRRLALAVVALRLAIRLGLQLFRFNKTGKQIVLQPTFCGCLFVAVPFSAVATLASESTVHRLSLISVRLSVGRPLWQNFFPDFSKIFRRKIFSSIGWKRNTTCNRPYGHIAAYCPHPSW